MFRLSMDIGVDKTVTLMRLNRCRYVISEPIDVILTGSQNYFYRDVILVVVSYNRVVKLTKIHFVNNYRKLDNLFLPSQIDF